MRYGVILTVVKPRDAKLSWTGLKECNNNEEVLDGISIDSFVNPAGVAVYPRVRVGSEGCAGR